MYLKQTNCVFAFSGLLVKYKNKEYHNKHKHCFDPGASLHGPDCPLANGLFPLVKQRH